MNVSAALLKAEEIGVINTDVTKAVTTATVIADLFSDLDNNRKYRLKPPSSNGSVSTIISMLKADATL